MTKQVIKTVKTAKVASERKAKAIRVPTRKSAKPKSKALALNKGIINQIPDIVSIPLLKKEKDVIKIPANLRMKERLENLRVYTPGGFVYKHGTRRQTVRHIMEN